MKEKQVWQFIKAAERGRPFTRWMRCENVASNGVPDINGCIAGHEFWMEVKCPKVHQRPDTPVFGSSHPIGPQQFAWFKAQSQAGGRAYLLLCNESMSCLIDATQVDSSIHELRPAALAAAEYCLAYFDQPLKECWHLVRTALEVDLNDKK